MGYNGDMIIFSLIVFAIAMFFGYFVSQTYVESPTLGDVVVYTVKAYWLRVSSIILFVWWATS